MCVCQEAGAEGAGRARTTGARAGGDNENESRIFVRAPAVRFSAHERTGAAVRVRFHMDYIVYVSVCI